MNVTGTGAPLDIAWIAMGIPGGPLAAGAGSYVASNRYRVLLPGAALLARGHRVTIVNPEEQNPQPFTRRFDAVIAGKVSNPDIRQLEQYLALALDYLRQARAGGCGIIVDLCDNHFSDALRGAFTLETLRLADAVVTGSDAMGEVVRRHSALPLRTIGDPVEGRRGEPALAGDIWKVPSAWDKLRAGLGLGSMAAAHARPRPLRLAWFGHQSGLPSLNSALPEIAGLAAFGPVELEVVTAPGFGPKILGSASPVPAAFSLRYTPWSAEQTWRSLAAADIVVIPRDASDAGRSVKSANRLLEALWAGRYVVANAIPAYQRYADWAWISEDLATGVRWAVTHADIASRQVGAAQELVRAENLPDAIGAQWESMIRETVASVARTTAA